MQTGGKRREPRRGGYNNPCYYREFEGWLSTIDLTIASLKIALELEWSKEYKLRGSDHFSIIIEEEREASMKQ